MKKNSKTIFVCSNCGGEHSVWSGKCSYCGAWNSLRELKMESANGASAEVEKAKPIRLNEIKAQNNKRLKTKIEELDLVLGGGIVPGSVLLLGGNPGIGKSTLLWQVACSLAGKVVYIAGEESPEQMKLRAERLKLVNKNIVIFSELDVNSWAREVAELKPDLLIVDSIQTIYDSSVPGSPGSIIQIKQSAIKVINLAKKHSIATVLIGHVTKEGEVAGPKTLEHLVDGVFYLEGESGSDERFLRSQKNRFGPTDEVGIFTLAEVGLVSASQKMLKLIKEDLPAGVVLAAALEGSRVYFVEVQALVQKSPFGFPKRNAVGYDVNRLQTIIAVLGRHAGIDLYSHDVFLNIGNGYKLKDPNADLAILLALAGSYLDKSLPKSTLIIGEVDLAGRINFSSSIKRIVKAAQKMGFHLPSAKDKDLKSFIKRVFTKS